MILNSQHNAYIHFNATVTLVSLQHYRVSAHPTEEHGPLFMLIKLHSACLVKYIFVLHLLVVIVLELPYPMVVSYNNDFST